MIYCFSANLDPLWEFGHSFANFSCFSIRGQEGTADCSSLETSKSLYIQMQQAYRNGKAPEPSLELSNRINKAAAGINSVTFSKGCTTMVSRILNGWSKALTEALVPKAPPYPLTAFHFLPYTPFQDTKDLTNQDTYLNESSMLTRAKCLALVIATPVVQTISILFLLANRIAKIITLAHFWIPSESSLKERAWIFGKDVLQVALSPIIYLGLEISALYGLISPNNGRRLYASLERYAFGKALLAPCFQPQVKGQEPEHLCGGCYGF